MGSHLCILIQHLYLETSWCLFLSTQAYTPSSVLEIKHTRASLFDPETSSSWDSISHLFTVKFLPLVGISDASVALTCVSFMPLSPHHHPQHAYHTQTLFVKLYKYASETGGLDAPSSDLNAKSKNLSLVLDILAPSLIYCPFVLLLKIIHK